MVMLFGWNWKSSTEIRTSLAEGAASAPPASTPNNIKAIAKARGRKRLVPIMSLSCSVDLLPSHCSQDNLEPSERLAAPFQRRNGRRWSVGAGPSFAVPSDLGRCPQVDGNWIPWADV